MLCELERQFPPYDALKLANIFNSRIDIAIADDSLAESVIQHCEALAVRDNGSARQALDLLRLAGELAENQNANVTSAGHVEPVRSKLERVEEGM